jgi:flagellar basal body rod protein FlgC
MDFLTTFRIIGSGLSAQRKKMDAVTANIANISTTSTPREPLPAPENCFRRRTAGKGI